MSHEIKRELELPKKASKSTTQKKKKKVLQSQPVSSDEDDYNFMSEEGDNVQETMNNHLRRNQGQKGLISTLQSKNTHKDTKKSGLSMKKGASIPGDYANFVRKQKTMQIPAPTQALSKQPK